MLFVQGATCLPDHEPTIRRVCRFESADELGATVAQMQKVLGKIKPFVDFSLYSYPMKYHRLILL